MHEQTDERAIRGLVDTYAAAWNRGDGEGFASVFAEDADFTSIRLDRAHSRAEIAAAHDGIFRTVYKGTRLEAEVEAVRFVRPDVALVDVDAKLFDAAGAPFGPKQAHALGVAERREGDWRFVAFQNMVPVGRG